MTVTNVVGLLCAGMTLFGFVAVSVGPGRHRNIFCVPFYLCFALLLGVVALDYLNIIGASQAETRQSNHKAAGPLIWFAVMAVLSLFWGMFINRPYPEEMTLESWQNRRIKNNLALLAILIIGVILFYNLT
jgi:hypothetical protein